MTDFFSGKAGLSESRIFHGLLAFLLPAAVFFDPAFQNTAQISSRQRLLCVKMNRYSLILTA